jgi:hypothetical protein
VRRYFEDDDLTWGRREREREKSVRVEPQSNREH